MPESRHTGENVFFIVSHIPADNRLIGHSEIGLKCK